MIGHLLMFGRALPEKRAACLNQVNALQIIFAVDKKIFLFAAQRGIHLFAFGFNAEQSGQPANLFGKRLHGAQKRSLLIQRLTVPADKVGRDAKRGALGPFFNKSRTRRVPPRVAPGFKCPSQPSGRKTGRIRLALDQLLA